MKLIIDIDDNVFTRLFDNGVDTSSDDREVIDRAVRNGMPYDESPQGEWIHNGINIEGMDIYRCSVCNRLIVTWSARVQEYPYCHCGAKMKEV